MPSPDLTPYVDLTLVDEEAQDIFDLGLEEIIRRVPGYTPRETNMEVILLEAMALQIEHSVFAINRLPGTIFDVLMRLFNVERFLGTPAKTTLTFIVATTQGYTIPAGTRALLTGDFGSIVFALDANLNIVAGTNTATGAATAETSTADFNGTVAGTDLALIDAVPFVDYVRLGSTVTGGADEEDDAEWRSRGAARFTRLTETLVLPRHFVQAALENALVTRAYGIDNYAPGILATPSGVTATPSGTGGTLAIGTYSYRVSAINQYGETLASAAVTATTTTATSSVAVAWNAVVPTEGASEVTGYRVYGRVGGAEGLLASVGAGTLTYTDTGAAAVGVAPRTSNNTGGPVGAFPGHVTVAVYGNGAFLPTADKDALETSMDASTASNLAVHVIDPTITTVDVTATVRADLGFDPAWVRTEAENALRQFLNPATWLWSGTVRINELISVLDQSLGVNYVEAITVPAADVALAGVAPLVQAGTLNITVTTP